MMNASITIERKMTMNIGDYSNISPCVTVRIDDVPLTKLPNISKYLSTVVSGLFAIESASLADEAQSIRNLGYNKYAKEISERETNIRKVIDASMEKINE